MIPKLERASFITTSKDFLAIADTCVMEVFSWSADEINVVKHLLTSTDPATQSARKFETPLRKFSTLRGIASSLRSL